MHYHFDAGNLAFYFLTKNHSRKYLDLMANPHASFSVFNQSLPTSLIAECDAEVLEFSMASHRDIITRLIATHSTQEYHPSPISTMQEGELALIRLRVTDFSFNAYQQNIERLQSHSF